MAVTCAKWHGKRAYVNCVRAAGCPCLQAAPAFPDSFPHMFGERKDVR